TLKDINNYNTTTPASYVKHYQATIGSNLTITPTWRYADSGSFQFPPAGFIFALPTIASMLNDRLREFAKLAEKALPNIKDVHAQDQSQRSIQDACKLADIVPIIGAAVMVIASVTSLLSFRRETDI
ncbi:MAG: hypothetical protein QXQ68_07450, partial [Candidatus Nitrosocaldaceae archaeon]